MRRWRQGPSDPLHGLEGVPIDLYRSVNKLNYERCVTALTIVALRLKEVIEQCVFGQAVGDQQNLDSLVADQLHDESGFHLTATVNAPIDLMCHDTGPVDVLKDVSV